MDALIILLLTLCQSGNLTTTTASFTRCSLPFDRVDNSASEPLQQELVVTFSRPLGWAEFEELFGALNLRLLEIHYASGSIQGGCTVRRDASVHDTLIELERQHVQFLNVALDDVARQRANLRDTRDRDRVEMQERELPSALEEVDSRGMHLTGIVVPNGTSLETLAGHALIGQVTVVQFNSRQSDVNESSAQGSGKQLEEPNGSGPLASSYHESWAPYGGTSQVTQYYAYNTFYFNSPGQFTSIGTYEHETQVYNKSFADYNYDWSSNLPNAYYDTPFLDSIDNFTVGSAQASAIQPYTQYYTYMALRPGSASSATVRVKGQKGHRFPSWCYSTWCVFADATTSSMATFVAPTGMSWQY